MCVCVCQTKFARREVKKQKQNEYVKCFAGTITVAKWGKDRENEHTRWKKKEEKPPHEKHRLKKKGNYIGDGYKKRVFDMYISNHDSRRDGGASSRC